MNKNLPIKWDIQAKESLDQLFAHIQAKASTSAARKIKKKLIHFISSLNNFPEKFHKETLLEHTGKNYRSVVKMNYKIIYEITKKEIIITYIFHSRQDLKPVLNIVR